MRERPILFTGEMVRAILAGRKTQTRRICKLHPALLSRAIDKPMAFWRADRLWVRETFAIISNENDGCVWDPGDPEYQKCPCDRCHVEYKADTGHKYPGGWDDDMGEDPECAKWGPSIHMPRWASRITLEVLNVKVERIKDISEQDSINEGMPKDEGNRYLKGPAEIMTAKEMFEILWDSINKKRGYGWETNPWVWVIEFKKEPR